MDLFPPKNNINIHKIFYFLLFYKKNYYSI